MELDNGCCVLPRAAASLDDEVPRRSYKKRCASGVFVADITRDMLRSLMHLPSHQAARSLGIGITVFKKLCRQRGIQQWPYVKPSFRTEGKGAGKADSWRHGARSSSSGGCARSRACRGEQLSGGSAVSSDVVAGPPRPLLVAPVRAVPGEPGAACRLQRLLEVLKGSSPQGELSPSIPGKLYQSRSNESALTSMGGAAVRQGPPAAAEAAYAQVPRQVFQPAAGDNLAPNQVAAEALEEACLARAPAAAEPLGCIAQELAKDPGLLLAALQRLTASQTTSKSPGSTAAAGRLATASGGATAAVAAVAAVLRQAAQLPPIPSCEVPASPFLHLANEPLPTAVVVPHHLVPPTPAAGSLELPAVQSAMLCAAAGSTQPGSMQHAAVVSHREEQKVRVESLRGHRRPQIRGWPAQPAPVSGYGPRAEQEPLATAVLALAAAAAAADDAQPQPPVTSAAAAVAAAAAETPAAVIPRPPGKEQKNRVVIACLMEEQRHYVRMQQLQALLGQQPPTSLLGGKPGREP